MPVREGYFRLSGLIRLPDKLTFRLCCEWSGSNFFNNNDSRRREKGTKGICEGNYKAQLQSILGWQRRKSVSSEQFGD